MTDHTAPHNGVAPDAYQGRHPGVVDICRFFDYGHLPPPLQQVSMPFAQLVDKTLRVVPVDSPELTTALRKILEAKDAAVRAALPNPQ